MLSGFIILHDELANGHGDGDSMRRRKPDTVEHICNLSTQETAAKEIVTPRPACDT